MDQINIIGWLVILGLELLLVLIPASLALQGRAHIKAKTFFKWAGITTLIIFMFSLIADLLSIMGWLPQIFILLSSVIIIIAFRMYFPSGRYPNIKSTATIFMSVAALGLLYFGTLLAVEISHI